MSKTPRHHHHLCWRLKSENGGHAGGNSYSSTNGHLISLPNVFLYDLAR